MRALHLRTRRWLVGAVSISVVVLSMLGSGTALAAKPNLIVTGNGDYTTNGNTDTTAQPTVVSTNDTVQFTTEIYNADTSNVSQLFFDILDAGAPSGFTVTKVTSTRSSNNCSTTTVPLCTFGALRPNNSVRVTVILTSPASTAGATLSCDVGSDGYNAGDLGSLTFDPPGGFCFKLRWSANGAPSSDGGTSHGDYFIWRDGVGLSGDAINFHGRFVYLEDQKVVGNSLNVSNSNKQGTQVTVKQLDVPVTVRDGSDIPSICTGIKVLTDGSSFDCDTLTSEVSIVEVARGRTITLFPLLIKFNQAPTNLKGSTPVALHEYVDPATGATVLEKISAVCVLKNGVPTPTTQTIPCLVVSNGGKQVIIWNRHNGRSQF